MIWNLCTCLDTRFHNGIYRGSIALFYHLPNLLIRYRTIRFLSSIDHFGMNNY